MQAIRIIHRRDWPAMGDGGCDGGLVVMETKFGGESGSGIGNGNGMVVGVGWALRNLYVAWFTDGHPILVIF